MGNPLKCISCNPMPHSPRRTRLFHVVGYGGSVAPHVELPLPHADQTRQNAAAVDPDAHVHVHFSHLSARGKKGKGENKPTDCARLRAPNVSFGV